MLLILRLIPYVVCRMSYVIRSVVRGSTYWYCPRSVRCGLRVAGRQVARVAGLLVRRQYLLCFMLYLLFSLMSYVAPTFNSGNSIIFFNFMHKNRVHLIAEFHQLCRRQFALIIESLHSILIQIRLVRDLERAGDEAPLSSS